VTLNLRVQATVITTHDSHRRHGSPRRVIAHASQQACMDWSQAVLDAICAPVAVLCSIEDARRQAFLGHHHSPVLSYNQVLVQQHLGPTGPPHFPSSLTGGGHQCRYVHQVISGMAANGDDHPTVAVPDQDDRSSDRGLGHGPATDLNVVLEGGERKVGSSRGDSKGLQSGYHRIPAPTPEPGSMDENHLGDHAVPPEPSPPNHPRPLLMVAPGEIGRSQKGRSDHNRAVRRQLPPDGRRGSSGNLDRARASTSWAKSCVAVPPVARSSRTRTATTCRSPRIVRSHRQAWPVSRSFGRWPDADGAPVPAGQA
jgi:hypothetical protein